MNNLLKHLKGDKQQQYDISESLKTLSSASLAIDDVQQCLTILSLNRGNLTGEECQIIIQIATKGLLQGVDSIEALTEVSNIIQNQSSYDKTLITQLYFAALFRSQKLKKKIFDQQSIQDQLNRCVNKLEDKCHIMITQLLQVDWSDQLILVVCKSVKANSTLFRNQQRQLQEHCVNNFSIRESIRLFVLLSWCYLEGKQGSISFIINSIKQIFDCLYIMTSLLTFDIDNLPLYEQWMASSIAEDIKQNLSVIFYQNKLLINQQVRPSTSGTKYSIYFQIIKPILIDALTQQSQLPDLPKVLELLLEILIQQFQYIKEEVVIELPISDMINQIQQFHVNQQLSEYLIPNRGSTTHSLAQSQIQTRLQRLQIERRFSLNLPQYKDQITQIITIQIKSLELLIPIATINQGQVHQIISSLIQDRFTLTHCSVQLSRLIAELKSQDFLFVRPLLKYSNSILNSLEQQFPQLLKDLVAYYKQLKFQSITKITEKKNQKIQKQFSLGIAEAAQIDKYYVESLELIVKQQLIGLKIAIQINLQHNYDLLLNQRLQQFIFSMVVYPFDVLLQLSALPELLKLLITLLKYYFPSEACILQPILALAEAAARAQPKLSHKLLSSLSLLRLRSRHTVVDNFVSTIKILQEQYQYAKQLTEEVNYPIKKVKSLEPSDEAQSNKQQQQLNRQETVQSDEIFFSIQNIGVNRSLQNDIQQSQSIYIEVDPVEVEDDGEIPKAVFD